jgi:hypothetical protein
MADRGRPKKKRKLTPAERRRQSRANQDEAARNAVQLENQQRNQQRRANQDEVARNAELLALQQRMQEQWANQDEAARNAELLSNNQQRIQQQRHPLTQEQHQKIRRSARIRAQDERRAVEARRRIAQDLLERMERRERQAQLVQRPRQQRRHNAPETPFLPLATIINKISVDIVNVHDEQLDITNHPQIKCLQQAFTGKVDAFNKTLQHCSCFQSRIFEMTLVRLDYILPRLEALNAVN